MHITDTVNGHKREIDDVWEGERLLHVPRVRMGPPGSRKACEQGACGSCTVYIDAVHASACLVSTGQIQGSEVVTVEGLADEDGLHPVLQAFLAMSAVRCGFCSPGPSVQTHDLLARTERPSDSKIREALGGNLCRCTGYEKILDAVRLAAERTAGTTP